MTLKIALALCASAIAGSALAAEMPLLVKATSPGFTMPAFAISTECKLFSNRVEVSTSVLGGTVSEVRVTAVNAGLRELIRKAATGRITRSNGAVDIPTAKYYIPTNRRDPIYLQFTNGGTGTNLTNESEEAKALVNLLDLVCDTEPRNQFGG